MATRNLGVGYLIACAIVTLAFVACGESKKPEPIPTAETALPEPPPPTVSGTIDFMDGEVSVRLAGGDWRDAELGDQVSASDSIRTGRIHLRCGFGPFGLYVGRDSTVESRRSPFSERNIASCASRRFGRLQGVQVGERPL
jgi:hypothetical protein